MFNEARYRKTFDQVHASEGTLTEVLNMTVYAKTKTAPGWGAKRALVLAAVMALLLALGATAYAIGSARQTDAARRAGFFGQVFGGALPSQEAHTVTFTDDEGHVVKTERYPSIQRVAVDAAEAERLLGGAVFAVDETLTIGDARCTVRELFWDENGIGAVTVEIDIPEGHGLTEEPQRPAFSLSFADSRGRPMGSREYPVPEDLTERHATLICFLTPFAPQSGEEDLVLSFRLGRREESLRIALPARLPAADFTAEGLTASLSPMGLTVPKCYGRDMIADEIVIRCRDGSAYRVKAEGVHNLAVSSQNDEAVWYCFNRLVDVAQVASIEYSGHYWEGETSRGFSFTLLPGE